MARHYALLAVDCSRDAWHGRERAIALDACGNRADARLPGWMAPAGNDRMIVLLPGRTMSKKHVQQKRAAKAARRKKLLTERRKAAIAESQISLATRIRRMAGAPIHSCLISEALSELGKGYLLLARKAADGRMAMATFLLDLYCLGVKDVILRVDEPSEIESFIEAVGEVQPMIAIEPTRARKLLHDLVAWSRSIGLAPHPDYAAAEPLFGDVPADPGDASFPFGQDGKPFLMPGPDDTPARIRKWIEALRRTVGDGGFDYMPDGRR